MKSNTSRDLRTAFDQISDVYDRSRPRWSMEIVRKFFEKGILKEADLILEIGAGTGQLTESLASSGLNVVALEPGHEMADVLREKLETHEHCVIVEAYFEEFETKQKFSGIFAANSFHWLDPEISYAKAHGMLCDQGCLYTLWNFPIVADTALQNRLNEEVFVGELSDLKRDPEKYYQEVQEIANTGIDELEDSGFFTCRWHGKVEERLVMNLATYSMLLSSFAATKGLFETIQGQVVDVCSSDTIVLKNYVSLRIADRIYSK